MAISNRFQPPEAGKPVQESLNDVSAVVDQLALLAQYKPAQDAIVSAVAGDFKRLAPRATGQNVVIPTADGSNFGKTITLFVESALGSCRVRPVTGTINGATSFTLAAGYVTLIVLISNGQGKWATQRASGFPIAGNALEYDGETLNYVGSTSKLNITPTSGDLNVVDISTLQCGGVLTFQAVSDTDATIDGFTVKPEGFWFVVQNRDASTAGVIRLLENSGNTTTSIRTPDIRDHRLYKNDGALLIYNNSRWRTVASMPRIFLTGVDTVTIAAKENNHARTSSGQNRIRFTLTGSQQLSGVVPDDPPAGDGSPNGEIIAIDNIDGVDILTITHDDAASTAANRFHLPDGRPFLLLPRMSATFAYDATTLRWRMIGAGVIGYSLTQATQQTVTNATTNLTAGTLQIPAGSLVAGSEYEIAGYVHTSRGATATAANVTITLAFAGASKAFTIATTVTSGHLGYAIIRGRITCRTTGATGTANITLYALQTISIASATPNTVPPIVSMDPAPSASVASPTTIDTTIDNTIELRAAFSTAVANLSMHMYECTIKRVR